VSDEAASTAFQLELSLLKTDTFRFKFYQRDPLREPFQVPLGLGLVESVQNMKAASGGGEGGLKNYTATNESIRFHSGEIKVVLNVKPFRLDIYGSDDGPSGLPDMSFNEKGYLHYERQRKKEEDPGDGVEEDAALPEGAPELTDAEKELRQLKRDLRKDMWEESFGGKRDSKPFGKFWFWFLVCYGWI
jgi:hypothetical protein